VVLDGAGQMVGAFFLGSNVHPLPVSVDAIELYQPKPAPGTRLPVQVELAEVDLEGRRIRANMEVQDGRGQVWFRVVGWQDVLFVCSERWSRSMRKPREATLAAPLEIDGLDPGLTAVQVRREDVRQVPPDWLARSYLAAAEETAAPWMPDDDLKRWIPWMLGRIAAKDAARLREAGRSGRARLHHPIEVVVTNDENGQPRVELPGPGGPAPAVSLAHTDSGAVAVAGAGPVGIDLEPLDAGDKLVLEDFTTEAERALLEKSDGGRDEAGAVTRLWCAKEAAAKMLGSGLQGRPASFEVVKIAPGGRITIRHAPTGRLVEVRTTVRDGLLVAVAAGEAPVLSSGEERWAGR
jgi:phosphopantetheinyl transferase (holo-ACP synthase)